MNNQAITAVIEYVKGKGRSLLDLATKAKPAVIASATSMDVKEVESIIKAAAKVAEKNPGRASNCLKELSDSVLATLAGAIEKNLNGGAKAPAATSTTLKPVERATIVNMLTLSDDRLRIESMRIGMRLLRQDGNKDEKEQAWPTAHLGKQDGGQNWRFEKVIETVSNNLKEETTGDTMSPTELEKKLTGAFTGLQRKIYREAKAEIAGEDFNSYLRSIGFDTGKTTDPDKGTVSKADSEEAIALMQRKSLDPADALSIVTDMDWPVMNGANTSVAPPPIQDDDGFSNEPAAEPVDDGFAS